jgi:hypothetical protein
MRNVKRRTGEAHRPLIPIDWKQVDEWIKRGSLGTHIAACLGICSDTLYDRCQQEHGIGFSEYLAQKRSVGDTGLLGKQYDEAMNGNTTLLIWLGKVRLGQKETEPDDQNKKGTVQELCSSMKEVADALNSNIKDKKPS